MVKCPDDSCTNGFVHCNNVVCNEGKIKCIACNGTGKK
jgi:hypothetical protein